MQARGLVFNCRIFGTGPLEAELERRAEAAGLTTMVELPGWAPAGQVPVEPDDVPALADALERVLTDAALSARFGAAARARIAEEFTLEVASSRLPSLFQSTPVR